MTKEYSGINIQWPISAKILSGEKTIETRTYPIPNKYIGRELILIETPGKRGKFKSRMIGIIRFTRCFRYEKFEDFHRDQERHLVGPDSDWAWNPNKEKWGWETEVIDVFASPKPLQKRSGVRFSTGIKL